MTEKKRRWFSIFLLAAKTLASLEVFAASLMMLWLWLDGRLEVNADSINLILGCAGGFFMVCIFCHLFGDFFQPEEKRGGKADA